MERMASFLAPGAQNPLTLCTAFYASGKSAGQGGSKCIRGIE